MPPTVSYQPAVDFVKNSQAEGQRLLDTQKGEQNSLIDEFAKIRGSQESLSGIYDRYAKEAGIGELRSSIGVFNTESSKVKALLDSLDEDVNSRTTGTFTTEAQRNRQKAVEGDSLRTNLSRMAAGLDPLVQAYGLASDDIGARVNLASQDQDRAVEPIRMRLEVLPDRFAREITGFNTAKQNELGVLMDKIAYDRDLTQREWERAQQLARDEREFARQKELMQYKAQLDLQTTNNQNAFQAQLAERLQKAMGGGSSKSPFASGSVEDLMLSAGLPKLSWNSGNQQRVTQRLGNEFVTTGTF